MAPPGSRPSTSHRAGIVHIATRLNISPSTVSRALRAETAHLVREDLRKAIRDLADKLQFSPNPGARMLRKGVNSSLTVIVPFDEKIFFSEFYGRFLSGTLHAAAARRWDVHISTLRRTRGADFRETLQALSMETSGLIYLAEPLNNDDVQKIQGYRRPLVLTKSALPLGTTEAELGLPVVGVDNLEGARSAAQLLLQLGHRRIGLLLGPSTSRDAHERKRGYLEVLEAAGARPRAEWIFEGTFSAETGRAGIAALTSGRERPTAVCCASDEIAFGAIDAARSARLHCPADISVVGFDDGPWATASSPRLTTIRQPLADMAERAVSLIVEAAANPGGVVRTETSNMAASIVIRDSTRAIASL